MRKIPLPRLKNKPHLAALLLIQSLPKGDLSETGQRELAAVLAFLHGKLEYDELGKLELAPLQQREALTITAILQISETLAPARRAGLTILSVEPSESGVWIILSGPAPSFDRKKTMLWRKIGYPEVDILDTTEAELRRLPFPQPLEKIGILPDDFLQEAGRKVMRYHFAQMLRHEAGTRLGEDIEALHDMRVATRRLRAAFEVFGDAFPRDVLRPHLKGLRATGRSLGAVRDLDVFMEKAQKYIKSLPAAKRSGLDPLLNHWNEERLQARFLMVEYLDSPEYARFKRDFNTFLNRPLPNPENMLDGEPLPTLVRQLAPSLVYERMASVRAFETHLQDAPIERLHMLRIEFKKLRYTVEYFREVLGKRSFQVIEDVKQLQDHLGDLNDAQVATLILSDFIAASDQRQHDVPIQERDNLEEVVNYMAARHAERHHLLVTFNEAWDQHFNNLGFRLNVAQSVSVL